MSVSLAKRKYNPFVKINFTYYKHFKTCMLKFSWDEVERYPYTTRPGNSVIAYTLGLFKWRFPYPVDLWFVDGGVCQFAYSLISPQWRGRCTLYNAECCFVEPHLLMDSPESTSVMLLGILESDHWKDARKWSRLTVRCSAAHLLTFVSFVTILAIYMYYSAVYLTYIHNIYL